MLFDPRVQVKSVECNPHFADANDDQPWANVAIEDATSDTAVGRSIAIADQPRLQRDGHGESMANSKTE